MDQSVDLNVVTFPNEAVEKKVIEWSGIIAEQFDSKYVLDGKKYRAHISFYQTRYPAKNLENIKVALKSIADSTLRFQIKMSGIECSLTNFVFYDSIKDDNLVNIHDRLLKTLNPLREGQIIPDHKAMLDDPALQIELKRNILEVGYPLSKGQFRPHITITRLKTEEEANGAARIIENKEMQFEVKEIALAFVDHDGTCKRVIEKFELKR